MVVGVILMVGYILRAPEVGGLSAGIDKLTAAAPGGDRRLAGLEPLALLLDGVPVVAGRDPRLAGHPHQPRRLGPAADGCTSSTRSATSRSCARRSGSPPIFAALMAGGAYLTGALSRLFPGIPELAAAKQFDQIMPTVLTEALPEALVAVILLLVLSASMSTLAGLVMISGSAITVDLVQGEIKRDLDKKTAVLLLRMPHRRLHPPQRGPGAAAVAAHREPHGALVGRRRRLLPRAVRVGPLLAPRLGRRRVGQHRLLARLHGRARLLLRRRQGDGRLRAGPGRADDDRVARSSRRWSASSRRRLPRRSSTRRSVAAGRGGGRARPGGAADAPGRRPGRRRASRPDLRAAWRAREQAAQTQTGRARVSSRWRRPDSRR